jgi:hypothetical protein
LIHIYFIIRISDYIFDRLGEGFNGNLVSVGFIAANVSSACGDVVFKGVFFAGEEIVKNVYRVRPERHQTTLDPAVRSEHPTGYLMCRQKRTSSSSKNSNF